MNRLSSRQIIEGIRKRDDVVLRFIYKSSYEPVRHLITNNSGTEEDAKDFFQEAMIITFRNINNDSHFEINCSIQTYIYSIARLLWMKHLRIIRNKMKKFTEDHEFIEFDEPHPFTKSDLNYSLYQKCFLELPEDCQKILRLTIDGISQKEIASLLGFKSENYIWKRKHFCKEYLIRKIKEHPDYQEDE